MADSNSSSGRDSIILLVVLTVNMLAMGYFGYYFWQKHHKEEEAQKIELAKAAALALASGKEAPVEKVENSYTQKIIRIESMITNLSGDSGRREVRLSLEAKCEGDGILDEIAHLKPKIRDAIILIVTSNTAEEISSSDGKEKLKAKILEQVNSMLTKGKLTEIYITEMELN
jgi:flagellar FliL protein